MSDDREEFIKSNEYFPPAIYLLDSMTALREPPKVPYLELVAVLSYIASRGEDLDLREYREPFHFRIVCKEMLGQLPVDAREWFDAILAEYLNAKICLKGNFRRTIHHVVESLVEEYCGNEFEAALERACSDKDDVF